MWRGSEIRSSTISENRLIMHPVPLFTRCIITFLLPNSAWRKRLLSFTSCCCDPAPGKMHLWQHPGFGILQSSPAALEAKLQKLKDVETLMNDLVDTELEGQVEHWLEPRQLRSLSIDRRN